MTLVQPLAEEPDMDGETSWTDVFGAVLDDLPEAEATNLLRTAVTEPLVFVAETISLHVTGRIRLTRAARRALHRYLVNEQTASGSSRPS